MSSKKAHKAPAAALNAKIKVVSEAIKPSPSLPSSLSQTNANVQAQAQSEQQEQEVRNIPKAARRHIIILAPVRAQHAIQSIIRDRLSPWCYESFIHSINYVYSVIDGEVAIYL